MKLSVVVPVYHVRAYLAACLDSLLEQGLAASDYEILCVDDGSTDGSGEIAEDYARRHRQITVLHQANAGVSAARNAGIRAASGEYLLFMDADDLLRPGVLGPLYRLAEENHLDQLLFDYELFQEGGPLPPGGGCVRRDRLRLFPDPLAMRRWERVPSWRSAWNYLVRRSVLEEYGLTFLEGALVFEDAEFSFWLDHCAGGCGFLDQKLYLYRRHGASCLHTYRSEARFSAYIQGRVGMAAHRQAVLRDVRAGQPPKLRTPVAEAEWEMRTIDEVQGILNNLLAKGDRALFQRTLAALREKRLYPYPVRWRRLVRKNSLGKRAVDAVSLLYPLEWYLRLCMRLRLCLPWLDL